MVTFEGVNACGGGFVDLLLSSSNMPVLPVLSVLLLRLFVPLSLALVCFGSSSAMHVVRVS